MTVAVLGATGTIGRSISRVLAANPERGVSLFARDPAALTADRPWGKNVSVLPLDRFEAGPFRLVINAIGAGDPARVAAMGIGIVEVTEFWDRRVLATMSERTRYVFMSSGAIYDADPALHVVTDMARLDPGSAYTVAKIDAEARHRGASRCAILDVRVFGYADVTLSLNGQFFLSAVARSVLTGDRLETSPHDMVRDYAGADELTQLICCWEHAGAPNTALDLYTKAPIGKFALLEIAQRRYGFDVAIDDRIGVSPTGLKPVYVSQDHRAAAIGYMPCRDSEQVVVDFLDKLFSAHRHGTRVS